MRPGSDETWTWVGAALAVGLALTVPRDAWTAEAPKVTVRFELNDALVKDRRLAGVEVSASRDGQDESLLGTTAAEGHLAVQLEPGEWRMSYRLEGYVPVERTRVTISGEATVTATLAPMLEAIGDAGRRRVQFVLNWGSDPQSVPDVDAHLRCNCASGREVYFGSREHAPGEHSATLDVDDMDGGGPETITLLDPPPGEHEYWVVRYSSPPPNLGGSQVVVRVIFDDRVAGEFRVPEGFDRQVWRPFKRLSIGPDLVPRIVPYSPEELAAGADRSTVDEDRQDERIACAAFGCCGGLPALMFGGLIAFFVVRRRRKR